MIRAGTLPLRKPGHLDLLADGLVCRVEARLELLERDLDGQLDPGRVEGLERHSSLRGTPASMGEFGRFIVPARAETSRDAIRSPPASRNDVRARGERAAYGG